MKLNLEREKLLKPLQMIIGVVERKQTLPILSNVLLDVKDNKLSLTGTDLEVELIGQSNLDHAATELGKITLPGRKLFDICKALPDGAPIELYQEKERVILKSGRSRFTLSTLSPNDFPNIDEKAGNTTFSIEQQKLRYLIQRTHFSMAQQDVRYYLNGMLLEICAGSLRSVATDGHRLALNTVDAPIKQTHRLQIIVPRKGILELLRLLEDNDAEVNVTVGNTYIQVTHDQYIFTSKLIEGRFPDYERVIPRNGDKIVIVNRDELKQALQRTAILCNEKFHGIRFEFRRGLLRIIANNPEQEAAEEEINIDYDQEDLDIGFNVNYLLDVLNVIESMEVKLTFLDANSSLRIEEPANENSIFVTMPMRL